MVSPGQLAKIQGGSFGKLKNSAESEHSNPQFLAPLSTISTKSSTNGLVKVIKIVADQSSFGGRALRFAGGSLARSIQISEGAMELSRLTRYELELMDVLWQRGEGTVQEVCDQLGRPLAYTTVMTTLRLLHSKKKVLKRVKRGRAHVYQPTVSRDDVSSSVLRDLQSVLFGDRLPTLMLGLLENGQFSQDDVDALKAALKNVESREDGA